MKALVHRSVVGLAVAVAIFAGSSVARADTYAYVFSSDGVEQVSTLDLNTGVASDTLNISYGGTTFSSGSVTYLPSTSTYYAFSGGTIYTLDPTTGLLSQPVATSGATLSGIAASNNNLYGASSGSAEIYLISPSTGVTTDEGASGLSSGGGGGQTADGASTILLVRNPSGADATFYTLSPGSGTASAISTTNVTGAHGLTDIGGTYYMSATNGGNSFNLYTVDPSTGLTSLVAAITNLPTGSTVDAFGSIAPAPVPELSSGGAMLLGALALLGLGRTRPVRALNWF